MFAPEYSSGYISKADDITFKLLWCTKIVFFVLHHTWDNYQLCLCLSNILLVVWLHSECLTWFLSLMITTNTIAHFLFKWKWVFPKHDTCCSCPLLLCIYRIVYLPIYQRNKNYALNREVKALGLGCLLITVSGSQSKKQLIVLPNFVHW